MKGSPNSSPHMALLGDPGQALAPCQRYGSLWGVVEGSHRIQTGLELQGVTGSAPVGSSFSPSPRPLSEAQGQIKGTQH